MLYGKKKLVALAAAAALALPAMSSATILSGPNDDPNAEGLGFGQNDLFSFSGWTQDDTRSASGNDFAAMTAASPGAFSGAGNSVPINPQDAGTAINGFPAIIAGNVIRLSLWLASDPFDPLAGDDLIQAGFLKMEFWNTALGLDRGTQLILDTEVDAGAFTDVRGALTTSDWTQFVFEYEVTQDILNAGLAEIRPVLIYGDFTGNPAPGPSGTVLLDRIIVEGFQNQSAADASPVDTTNPGAVPEPASLMLLGLGAAAVLRRRR